MSVDVTSLVVKVESQGIQDASRALSGFSTSAGNAEKRATSLAEVMKKLNTVNAESSKFAEALMIKLREQDALLRTMASNSRTAAGGTQALAAAMTLLSSSLNILVQQQTRADAQQRLHNNSMREGRALARGLSGSLGALWVTYGQLTGVAVGLAIGASLKGIVTVGKDVEATLEAIRVKGIETIDSVDKIRDSIMELGKGVYGPQVVAKAFETLILAGLSAKQALMGISDALNLATVGGTSIEKSAYTLVQVGTALGYTAENYGRIADVIAMTAAVSMSSVESLSEAFKSGSVVGKLYGVTLVDIGTSLAALSNLGIQGSAAGTSLKNFYKELASSSEKVKTTLKGMHLVPEDFKDAQGNYLGVLQVVEKLAQGMGNLTESQGKIAIANLSNERGMKTAIELLDLYKQKVGDATGSGEAHANMLSSLRQKIEDSYGFAAIGAAQMSLTVEAQFKSVANTLDTVFMEAFRKVSPEVTLVATQLKNAFNSPEFIGAIQSIAIGVAKLTVALAENIPLVVSFVEAVIAAKAFMFIVGVVESVTLALRGLATGAAAANLALGPLTIALLAAGAAYLYFTRERDNSNLSTSQKTAIKYSEDYADALDKEAERLRTQLDLMKQGKTAREAETQSMYAQQLAMAKLQGDKAKVEAENRLEKAGMGVTIADISASEGIVKRGGMMTGRVKEYKEAQANLAEVNRQVDASYERTVAGQKAIMQVSKELEQERKRREDADKLKGQSKGTGVLPVAPEKKTAEERAASSLAKKELSAFEALLKNANDKLLIEQGQADSTHKLTDAEKELLRVREQLDKNALHASPAQQAKLAKTEVELAKIVEYNYAMRTYVDQQNKAYTESNKAIASAEKEAEALEAKARAIGLNKAETAEMELARMEANLQQLYSIGLCTRETAELEALISAKKRSTVAQQEIERNKHHRTGEEGALEALKKYGDAAKDTGTLIESALTNAFKSAEDALVNFVMTGKLDFKSLANSIISDLVRIQAKQVITGMFGGGASGGGGMGMLGSFGAMNAGAAGLMQGYGSFAMANAGVAASQGLSIMDLAGAFADGGDPPVGQVSLVGERGPELFVPKTAGTIIPNHMLNASAPHQSNTASSNDRPMQYTIVNQTTGRIDSVKEQRLSDDERALIISEAVNATASSLYDTNSRMSKGMRNTHDVQRKR